MGIHQAADLGAVKTGLRLIRIDDPFLDLIQHFLRPEHLLAVTDGDGGRIVDDHIRNRGHQRFSPGHSDHAGRRSRETVYLDGDLAGIFLQRVIYLRRRKNITARTIYPNSDVTFSGR